MPVLRESQIFIQLNENGRGLKISSAAALDGKSRVVVSVYFDPVDTGHGFGAEILHGPHYPLDLMCPVGTRKYCYKYYRGLPEKYLALVKELEATLK